MANIAFWKETYLNSDGDPEGGSKEAEEIFFDKISEQIKELITHFATDNNGPKRGNHAKILAGIMGAQFRISNDIPSDLQVGFLIPGRIYQAIARFSNANGRVAE